MTAMRSHAVVVGASMAGLLAARSLLDHYERVTIVDRDDIPSRPQPRGGVPQGRHAHGLLAEGRTILEEMFPGLTSDLTARGARLGDVGLEGVWCFTPRPLARRESGLTALLVGGIGVATGVRAWLEARSRTIATLRCMGAPTAAIFSAYLIQVLALSALGIDQAAVEVQPCASSSNTRVASSRDSADPPTSEPT